jgi:hypothetical protein
VGSPSHETAEVVESPRRSGADTSRRVRACDRGAHSRQRLRQRTLGAKVKDALEAIANGQALTLGAAQEIARAALAGGVPEQGLREPLSKQDREAILFNARAGGLTAIQPHALERYEATVVALERAALERPRPLDLPRVDENGCYTLPDGSCAGCPHCPHHSPRPALPAPEPSADAIEAAAKVMRKEFDARSNVPAQARYIAWEEIQEETRRLWRDGVQNPLRAAYAIDGAALPAEHAPPDQNENRQELARLCRDTAESLVRIAEILGALGSRPALAGSPEHWSQRMTELEKRALAIAGQSRVLDTPAAEIIGELIDASQALRAALSENVRPNACQRCGFAPCECDVGVSEGERKP